MMLPFLMLISPTIKNGETCQKNLLKSAGEIGLLGEAECIFLFVSLRIFGVPGVIPGEDWGGALALES